MVKEKEMVRMPGVVVSGYPHHVTQCGNRRQKTFFYTKDYQMSEFTRDSGTDVRAFCLMLNHVIQTPFNMFC